jgi:SAM-dependent methyltransferase
MQDNALDVPVAQEQRRLVCFFSAIAGEIGASLPASATVLDFGCGDGSAVAAWRAAGHQAYGCDIALDHRHEWLRLIDQPYHLPFGDCDFDLVVSNQVLEHVKDHDVAFKEIRRVLKPGAASLHLFPPRWTPIEPHLHVPLATVVQDHWWLAMWARMGIRNRYQRGMPWRDVAALNVEYLRGRTNYLSRSELLTVGRRWFEEAAFIEELALKHGRRTRPLYPWARRLPVFARIYGGLRARLLLLRREGVTSSAL